MCYSQPCDIAWHIDGDQKTPFVEQVSEWRLTLEKTAGHLLSDLENVHLESRAMSSVL